MVTQLPRRPAGLCWPVVGAMLLLACGPISTALAIEWEIESVDDALLWVRDMVSVAVGADGTPYIAHDVSPEGTIHFVFRDPAGWTVEEVDGYYSSGGGAAVALDADGVPCLTYGKGNPDFEPVLLTFARRTPSGWSRTPIDKMLYDTRIALCFRADGMAVVVYTAQDSPCSMQYASQGADGTWHIVTADPDSASGYDVSMVLDDNDEPHICHWESVSGAAREAYTYREAGTWFSHVLESVGSCNVMGSGIGIDADGNVHMAWQVHQCASPGALKYAKKSASGWSTTTIHSGFSNYSAGCSLVVDRLGKPHVIYGTQGQLVGGPSQLRYAHLNDAGSWVHELVDGDGDCGETNSVAIDANGYLHVAYYAGDGYSQNGWIRYARSVEPVAPPPPAVTGDLNCDGAVNAFDIDPFVLALTSPAAYAAAFPACDYMLADIDGDGDVNAFDIDPFVALLTGN
jgi:hypothetical protein